MDGIRCNYHTFSISGTVFEVDVRYTNLRAVGSGSYGLVCAADDTITGNKVAIKKGPLAARTRVFIRLVYPHQQFVLFRRRDLT